MAALMVGVSGVRGIIGETLTPVVAAEFAQAFGTKLGGGRIALGRDTRPSGELFAAAAQAALTAVGCEVTQLGVVMTPTIGHAIRAGGYDGGVMITASHNPPEWNGIKFLDADGLAPSPELARDIAEIRSSGAAKLLQQGFQPLQRNQAAGRAHADAVKAALEVELAPLRGTKVVLDAINGAGCIITPTLLNELGLEAVILNGDPTGNFAHTPEPIAENLTALCTAVREQNAAIGLAQDPDADRLALVDEHGNYIGEEYTLALAVWSVLRRRPGKVAANLSTSRMVDVLAQRYNTEVLRTAVGEANVARQMKAEGCVIGGEGNGGVIDPRITWVRDSLSSITLVLQLMAEEGKTVSELVAELPRFVMIKEKFPCPRERIAEATAKAAEAFAGEKVDRADGTRIDFADGWVHLRASNTEPIVRIIAEAEQRDTAERLITRVRENAGI